MADASIAHTDPFLDMNASESQSQHIHFLPNWLRFEDYTQLSNVFVRYHFTNNQEEDSRKIPNIQLDLCIDTTQMNADTHIALVHQG